MDYVGAPLRAWLATVLPDGYTEDTWTVHFLCSYILFTVGAYIFYGLFASFSYFFFFRLFGDRFFPLTLTHDLSDQMRTEIRMALTSFPLMGLPMCPLATLVSKGYSKMYYNVDDYGWTYLVLSVPLFLFFTDMCIYWIHRGLHIPVIYQHIHKPHHTYRFTTPFSSHAFHPLDGFAQGAPYYIFLFLFPMHHILHVCMFMFVNYWTISIHDQVDFQGDGWILSTGHHTIHHADFVKNYGQYTTLWDRLGGTYKPAQKTNALLGGERLITPQNAMYALRKNKRAE